MPELHVLSLGDVDARSEYARARDAKGVVASRLLAPEGVSLWVCVSTLEDGGELRWNGNTGEEAVYVLSGALDVEESRCPEDGAVIVEAGVKTAVRAVGTTEIVHFGPRTTAPPAGRYGRPEPEPHGVHVVGPGGWFTSGTRAGTFARWYADSTCPTCRLCLIRVERDTARTGPPHQHSEDEIIYVIGGSIALGGRWLEPHTALFIPADARYQIRTGDAGYRFLNYRRDVSEQIYDPAESPQLESALARGGSFVGDLL